MVGQGWGNQTVNAPTHELTIEEDGECILSKQVASDGRHRLHVHVDPANSDVYFDFSSRQALYDFAKSLLHEAVYGQSGRKEFYPLIADGQELVVEGARLTEGSSRLFISYSQAPSGSA
jgi:hypothetical protein